MKKIVYISIFPYLQAAGTVWILVAGPMLLSGMVYIQDLFHNTIFGIALFSMLLLLLFSELLAISYSFIANDFYWIIVEDGIVKRQTLIGKDISFNMPFLSFSFSLVKVPTEVSFFIKEKRNDLKLFVDKNVITVFGVDNSIAIVKLLKMANLKLANISIIINNNILVKGLFSIGNIERILRNIQYFERCNIEKHLRST